MGDDGGPARRVVRYLGAALALCIGAGALHDTFIDTSDRSGSFGVPRAIAAEKTKAAKAVQAVASKDYDAAKWHPSHFKPDIDQATNEQCLSCHREILTKDIRATSPAGVKAAGAQAWYQSLSTYAGPQQTFHARHLTTPFAKQVMTLSCNFCHQGHDPREEAPGSSATTANVGDVALRKQVNPAETCLKCHGTFPFQNMDLPGPWHEAREQFETADVANGCLGACHKEIRTNRHNVSYLNGAKIEELAQTSSDVCYGCHGGRAWYRISYPYPRNAYPGMPRRVPAWAKDRPTQSDPRYAVPAKKQ